MNCYLRTHLTDSSGALEIVLSRAVAGSELLLNDFDQPLDVLATFCRRIIASESQLQELVRATDAEWGSIMGERPHFEKSGRPTDPDDPYTIESVRATLSGLVQQLDVGR